MSVTVHIPDIASRVPAPVRSDSPERWARASERALLAQVIVTPIDELGTFRVTSATYPGVSYESDGMHCTCQAAAHDDPVCLHRAAVRDHLDAQRPCPTCGDSGIEWISLWDWRNGCAVSHMVACGCTQRRCVDQLADDIDADLDAIFDQLAQPVRTEIETLERELADAKAVLARIDDQLEPFNYDLKYGDGRFELANRRQFDRLMRQREIADQRVQDAAAAVNAARGKSAA